LATTPGKSFYDGQIRALEEGNLDALIEQYTDDSLLLGYEVRVRGREALREYMRGYMARSGSFRLVSTDKWAETDNSILFEATLETDLGMARVYDAFVLRDGKAAYQFTGILSLQPKS
jgi:nuclear transport factor 2 (NTF2) superfamily protein